MGVDFDLGCVTMGPRLDSEKQPIMSGLGPHTGRLFFLRVRRPFNSALFPPRMSRMAEDSIVPRDAWARARSGDAANRTLCTMRTEPRGRRKLIRTARSATRICARCSGSTKLWFGKYRDTQITQVPLDYLRWLVSRHRPGMSWRIDGLVLYLKSYLAKELSGSGDSVSPAP